MTLTASFSRTRARVRLSVVPALKTGQTSLTERGGIRVVMAAGHEPDDRVRILGDLLIEREVAIDAHDDDGQVVLLLDRGEGLVHLAEELPMRLVPARRID